MAQTRSYWRIFFTNFLNSFKRKPGGVFIGKDHFGSEYYEFQERRGGRKPRWCIPKDENNFEQEIPPEWEAWLRHRRQQPPTEEEIQTNMLRRMKTLENARRLEKGKEAEKVSKDLKFPVYEEFEENPGAKLNKKI